MNGAIVAGVRRFHRGDVPSTLPPYSNQIRRQGACLVKRHVIWSIKVLGGSGLGTDLVELDAGVLASSLNVLHITHGNDNPALRNYGVVGGIDNQT